jgi:hypothetical protein
MSTIEPNDIRIPTVPAIRKLLDPIEERLVNIENSIVNTSSKADEKKYYRNNDLKKIFGLSSNTIIKYRETGVLPFTKLGEVYLYEVKKIDEVLKDNSVNL